MRRLDIKITMFLSEIAIIMKCEILASFTLCLLSLTMLRVNNMTMKIADVTQKEIPGHVKLSTNKNGSSLHFQVRRGY